MNKTAEIFGLILAGLDLVLYMANLLTFGDTVILLLVVIIVLSSGGNR